MCSSLFHSVSRLCCDPKQNYSQVITILQEHFTVSVPAFEARYCFTWTPCTVKPCDSSPFHFHVTPAVHEEPVVDH